MKKENRALFLITAALVIASLGVFAFGKEANAETPVDAGGRSKMALGYTVDLLPITLSAVSGRMGFSFQTWMGIERVRLRLVGAQMRMPDAMAEDRAFDHHDLTAGALIMDYIFGSDFGGWWVGSGFELWQNRLRHRATGEKVEWTSQVFTVGGGYSWKVAGNVFIEPWAAAHAVMNNRMVRAGGDEFTPRRFSAELSLKVGYFFSL